MKSNLILYHAHCTDGIFAAWSAWRHFGQIADYIPVQYGTPPPYDQFHSEQTVYLVDFSYPAEILTKISEWVKKLVILDHHEGAADALAQADKLPNVDAYYDSERCGSMMTWDYFHADKARPVILDYVDDYDRWQWKMEATRAVSEYIRLEEPTLEWAHQLAGLRLSSLIATGNLLVKQTDNIIDQLASSPLHYPLDGIPLMVVNAPRQFKDLLGNKLAEKAASGCGVVWHRRDHEEVYYSARSVDKPGEMTITALELAKRFGGGGHRNAAGFSSDKYPEELFR